MTKPLLIIVVTAIAVLVAVIAFGVEGVAVWSGSATLNVTAAVQSDSGEPIESAIITLVPDPRFANMAGAPPPSVLTDSQGIARISHAIRASGVRAESSGTTSIAVHFWRLQVEHPSFAPVRFNLRDVGDGEYRDSESPFSFSVTVIMPRRPTSGT